MATTECVECGKAFEKDAWPGRPRITCSIECKRKRRNRQIKKYRDKTLCPEHLHGTITGYSTYSCDCTPCRLANREYARKRREAALANQ